MAMAAYLRFDQLLGVGHAPMRRQLEVAGYLGSPARASSAESAEIPRAGREGLTPAGEAVRPASPLRDGDAARYRPCAPPPRRIIFVIAGTSPRRR